MSKWTWVRRWDPCDGRKGREELDEGIASPINAHEPAEEDTEWNGQDHSRQISEGDAAEGALYVLQQQALLRQLRNAENHLPWLWGRPDSSS